MKKLILKKGLLLVLTFVCVNVFAQKEYSLKFGASPRLDNFEEVFNTGRTVNLQMLFNIYEMGDNYATWGFALGYSNFASDGDTLTYDWRGGQDGTITFSDNHSIFYGVQTKYHFGISEKFEAFAGIELGYLMVLFSYYEDTPWATIDGGSEGGKIAANPKAGFSFAFSDNIGFQAEAQYNAYFSTGADMSLSTDSPYGGPFNSYFTICGGLYYRLW